MRTQQMLIPDVVKNTYTQQELPLFVELFIALGSHLAHETSSAVLFSRNAFVLGSLAPRGAPTAQTGKQPA